MTLFPKRPDDLDPARGIVFGLITGMIGWLLMLWAIFCLWGSHV